MTAPVRPEIDLSHLPLVQKLRANHPGAAMALMSLLRLRRRLNEPIDADALWCLGALDTLGICGSELCEFWCSCDQSAERMIQILRACPEGCYGLGYDGIRRAIASESQAASALINHELVSAVPGL